MTEHTKPKKRNADASRQKLLTAAIEAFSAKGPDAATIDDICEKADLNKRLVYHYFGSKEGLYRRALRIVYEQFMDLEVELGSMMLPVEELLETLVGRYYEFLRDHPDFVRMISYENLNNGKAARELNLAGQKAPVITALQLALEKGQSSGRFRKGIDVQQLLISVFALCFFYFSNHHTMGQFLGGEPLDESSLEARVKHVAGLLLHGIASDELRNMEQ